MTHFLTEAVSARAHTRARNGTFHGESVMLRHVRHAERFGHG
jgi:hypothetical protein